MPEALNYKEIAKFAAQGVAIALRARDENYRGPMHILAGHDHGNGKPELYKVTLQADAHGSLQIGNIEKQEQ